jgi:hypothetical protein
MNAVSSISISGSIDTRNKTWYNEKIQESSKESRAEGKKIWTSFFYFRVVKVVAPDMKNSDSVAGTTRSVVVWGSGVGYHTRHIRYIYWYIYIYIYLV